MGNHLEVLRQFNAWRRGEDERSLDETGLTPTVIGQAIDAAVVECEDRRRTERNRDMWKGQCDRQARVLTRISQLCTAQHESKEAFARRVQSVIEWGGQANG